MGAPGGGPDEGIGPYGGRGEPTRRAGGVAPYEFRMVLHKRKGDPRGAALQGARKKAPLERGSARKGGGD